MWLSYALTVSALVLGALAFYIYVITKKEAYRFFYPALVLFVFFSLVPISYSIYVSFTNLKTGHLLERKDVIHLIRDEKIIKEDSLMLSFQLFKKDEAYLLVVDNLSVFFGPHEKSVTLGPTQGLPDGIQKLSPGEIIDFIEQNPEFDINHPALGNFTFFRTDLLAQNVPRFKGSAETGFIDSISGKKLIEDKQNGQFLLDGESIGPGYYTFTGWENYKKLFFDPASKFVFFKAFSWTITWAATSVILTFIVGTFLAVLLNGFESKAKVIYRLIFIIPYSIPFFISVLIFKGMLNKDFGEINGLLSFFSLSPIPWLENKLWARVSVLLVNLWLGFPYMLLVVTGIIQSIPKSIYEASSLEGATRFQNFRYLTFPLVFKAMIPLLVGSFAFNLNNFVGIYLLTGGGPVIPDVSTPLGETDILISYTYRLAFEGAQGQDFATAAAVSMIIFIIIVLLTMLNFKVSKMVSK